VIKAGKNDGVPNKLLPDKLLKQGFFSVETQLAAFQFAPNRALRLSERAAAEAEMISSAFMIWLKPYPDTNREFSADSDAAVCVWQSVFSGLECSIDEIYPQSCCPRCRDHGCPHRCALR
jgi:hypothetical protein